MRQATRTSKNSTVCVIVMWGTCWFTACTAFPFIIGRSPWASLAVAFIADRRLAMCMRLSVARVTERTASMTPREERGAVAPNEGRGAEDGRDAWPSGQFGRVISDIMPVMTQHRGTSPAL